MSSLWIATNNWYELFIFSLFDDFYFSKLMEDDLLLLYTYILYIHTLVGGNLPNSPYTVLQI